MEYRFTDRDIRFFRVFGILGRVAGYKSLKSLYKIVESRFPSLREPPSYERTWTQEFFSPESSKLVEDLNSYMSRQWVLCSPFLRKRNNILEPIHHLYTFSLRGADIYIKNYLQIKKELEKGNVPIEDFVKELVVWKTLPPSCSVGWAMLTSKASHNVNSPDFSSSIPEYLIRVEEPMLEFDNKLVTKLYEWYNEVLGYPTEKPVKVKEEFLLEIRINPKEAVSRYDYLRLDWVDVGKSEEFLRKNLDTCSIPYSLRVKLAEGLKDKFNQIVSEILKEKENIQMAYESKIKKITSLSEVLSKTPVLLGFSSEGSRGYINLYISEDAKEAIKSEEDYLYLWHALQPVETARLLDAFDIDKVRQMIQG